RVDVGPDPVVLVGDDEHHRVARGRRGVDGVVDETRAAELGELLGPAEALTPTGGDDHRPDARNRHRMRYFSAAAFLAAAFLAGAFFAAGGGLSSPFSTSSRRASAASSSTLSANVSSDTRIWRARASMRFSPADRPLSASRMERFRTTSATW